MSDIRMVQFGEFPYQTEVSADWLLRPDGTLDDTEDLATAAIVALGTDRLAEAGDILPDPDSTDRRGWWADTDAELIWDGWPIGTRCWLLKRTKIVGAVPLEGATVVRVEHYIREALEPFITLKIVSRIEIDILRVAEQRIDALVRLFRGPETAIEMRYQVLWSDIIPESPLLPYTSGGRPFP